jgi:hypothetical protein
MPPIPQKYLPILFLLHGGGFPLPIVFGNLTPLEILRPEHYSLTRVSRGTVTQTIGGAFLDDFGEGPGQLLISGHTGWGAGTFGVPGVIKVKALEAMFVEYEARRMRLRNANLDPSVVQLWMMDSLNLEGLSLYPLEFSLDRARNKPLLYFYRMRFVVIADLLVDAVMTAVDAIGSTLSGVGGALTGLSNSFRAA